MNKTAADLNLLTLDFVTLWMLKFVYFCATFTGPEPSLIVALGIFTGSKFGIDNSFIPKIKNNYNRFLM